MSASNARDDLPEEHRDIGDANRPDKAAVMNSLTKGVSPWPVIEQSDRRAMSMSHGLDDR
jgi:hypothetical protein